MSACELILYQNHRAKLVAGDVDLTAILPITEITLRVSARDPHEMTLRCHVNGGSRVTPLHPATVIAALRAEADRLEAAERLRVAEERAIAAQSLGDAREELSR